MEGQVAPATRPQRQKTVHLMCGTAVWGTAGAAGSAYLAYTSFSHWRRQQFDWPHNAWFILTCSIWILFMAGLITGTRCWRERLFFTLVLANFAMGFTVAVWTAAPASIVRDMRITSALLWSLAALVSIVTTFSVPARSAQEKRDL